MKKYFKLLLCAAFGLGAFTACEDVPEPYNIPTENPTPVVTPTEPTGTGTLEDPFNAAAAIQFAKTLASDTESEQDVYIYGVVASVKESYSTNFGNASFYISDDGSASTQFYVYRALYLNNQKYSSGDNVEAGDTVIVCGRITNYRGNTPETVQNKAYLYSLKKGSGTPWTPVEDLVGSGTKDDPYDVPSTIKLIAAGPPSTKIYTKGKISQIDEIDTGSFGNATYYISNDGSTTDQLEVYRGYGLGGAKFTSTNDLKVGDEVIVYGQVIYYNNKTMEFSQGSELYMLNGEYASGTTPTGDPKGTGTKEDPFNVAAAVAGSGNAWVKAYIVGWIEGQKLAEGAHFNGTATVASNLLIADSPDETDVARCMPVQLPGGSEARTALNLQDNPGNYKKEVSLYGSIEKYFGAQGLKAVSDYVIDGSTPEPPKPDGDPSGSGTLTDPYNSVAAKNLAAALASGAQSDQAYYIKGKVVSIKEQFGAQYGNVSCYISDDGSTAGQFYVFRAYYLGNRKWVTGDKQIAVGDEIVVYAKLTNYQGNTPETVAGKEGQDHGYLYSLNGSTDGSGGGTPTPGGDTKTLADFTNGDFEAWTDGQPDGWKSKSSASNATLSQSTDAHGGSYSVKVGGTTSGNKRLAYEELELEAGTYNCSFWAKAATSSPASLCPGYASIGTGNPTYNYDKGDDGKNKYVNDIVQEWQKVSYSFTLTEKTTVCLIIMNSKTTGTDLLIDDFTIVKN